MLLDGKVALVTGAARGIGAATARLLGQEGARVVVADRREDEANAVVAELNQAHPGSALFVSLDVTAEADWQAAIETTEAAFGPISVLVNNAGIIRVAPLEQMTLENFRKVIDTNLVGTFLGLKCGAESLKRAGGGSIVNFSSVQGMEGRQGFTAYSASKFGIRGLTKSAAIELGPHNIRVNAVLPGGIATERQKQLWYTPEYKAEILNSQALKRELLPEDVARLVLFLAADDSSAITNQSYIVDGGWM